MPESYHVRVTKDYLVFCAAHFITFNGNVCERLHGHNYRVAAEVFGPLDENHYVIDFIALRDELKKIVPGYHARVGSKFCAFFTDVPVVDYATAKTCDTKKHGRYFHAMMENGVYLAPSQFEVGFMSLAHTAEDIEATLRAAREAVKAL